MLVKLLFSANNRRNKGLFEIFRPVIKLFSQLRTFKFSFELKSSCLIWLLRKNRVFNAVKCLITASYTSDNGPVLRLVTVSIELALTESSNTISNPSKIKADSKLLTGIYVFWPKEIDAEREITISVEINHIE